MSALGQKRTYAAQKGMSALPPIATAKADFRKRSCLLYPRKRTCAAHKLMSALGQKQTCAVHRRMSAKRHEWTFGGKARGMSDVKSSSNRSLLWHKPTEWGQEM